MAGSDARGRRLYEGDWLDGGLLPLAFVLARFFASTIEDLFVPDEGEL